ncbi:MAG TPA: hypothetical protein VLL28_09740 [Hyphomicrobiaceae bacterium]|nr:hypothetical protein [Hyphomicrobiaceae bacterium]
MITKRRCPHTGIVNFFSHSDPQLAVGSVSQTTSAATHYVWRSYLDDRQSGVAADSGAAEAHLRNAIARRPDAKPDRI